MTAAKMVAAAAELIWRRRINRERLFVAIDGCAGAGKSTLAKGIRDSIGAAAIVRTDHFYRPLNRYSTAPPAPEKAYELYFPWQRMRDEALMPLRRSEPARYQRYDWAADALGAWVIVAPEPIVIVEGVYSSRPELSEFIDATIFVEAPREVRIQRMLARGRLMNDPDNEWLRPWMAAEDWYLKNIRPHERAEMVLESASKTAPR